MPRPKLSETKRLPITVSLQQDLITWGKNTAKRGDVSLSELVNRAVRMYQRVHQNNNRDRSGETLAIQFDLENGVPRVRANTGHCRRGYSLIQRACGPYLGQVDGAGPWACQNASEGECPYKEGDD